MYRQPSQRSMLKLPKTIYYHKKKTWHTLAYPDFVLPLGQNVHITSPTNLSTIQVPFNKALHLILDFPSFAAPPFLVGGLNPSEK